MSKQRSDAQNREILSAINPDFVAEYLENRIRTTAQREQISYPSEQARLVDKYLRSGVYTTVWNWAAAWDIEIRDPTDGSAGHRVLPGYPTGSIHAPGAKSHAYPAGNDGQDAHQGVVESAPGATIRRHCASGAGRICGDQTKHCIVWKHPPWHASTSISAPCVRYLTD